MVDQITQAVNDEYMHFLDARRGHGRHADLDVLVDQQFGNGAPVAAGQGELGAAVDGLAGYRVAVAVTATALNGAPAKRVDVRVTHLRAPSVDLSLSGFRAAY